MARQRRDWRTPEEKRADARFDRKFKKLTSDLFKGKISKEEYEIKMGKLTKGE